MPDVIFRHVPGMATATPVPALDAASLSEETFLNDYVAHSRPCVIKGAVSHWEATEKWRDAGYLKSVGGHSGSYWPHERHTSAKRSEPRRRTLAFAEAIDLIQTADIAAFHTTMSAKLASDIAGFSFLTRREPPFFYASDRMIFFKNAGTGWHYHPWDETLMCQIKGPKQIGLLDVRNPLDRHLRRIFFKEDYYDNPFAFNGIVSEDLPWFLASLDAGDALYIPPHWWHGVIATSDDVGVTVPVTWKSPLPVIVDTVRKMAAGEIDIIGTIPADYLLSLLAFAREAGVEQEMKTAWDRCVREGWLVVGHSDSGPAY
jgi:quercetin dioxygenase-like cupin family protein